MDDPLYHSRTFFEFSLISIFCHVWEKMFESMVFAFLENALNLGIFTHAPVSHSKLQAEFFENLFPPTAKKSDEIRKNEDELED